MDAIPLSGLPSCSFGTNLYTMSCMVRSKLMYCSGCDWCMMLSQVGHVFFSSRCLTRQLLQTKKKNSRKKINWSFSSHQPQLPRKTPPTLICGWPACNWENRKNKFHLPPAKTTVASNRCNLRQAVRQAAGAPDSGQIGWQHSHVCRHSVTVVASMKYPPQILHVICGLIVFNLTRRSIFSEALINS